MGSVAQGAQRIPLLKLQFQAACGADVVVRSLSIGHSGRGDASDLSRVYALVNGQRVSHAVSLSARQPTLLTIASLTVPACQTKDLLLAADIAANAQAAGEHALSLVAVQASVPVTILASDVSAPARITPHPSQAAISVLFRPLLTSVSYGDGRIVARLLVTGGSTVDQQLNALTLTNDGSAHDADVQSLVLETSAGEQLSAPLAQMAGRTIHIVLTHPLVLQRNQSRLLQLRANVRASRTHTIQLTLDEPSDAEVSPLPR